MLVFSRTGLSNLLNKIQFTFEVDFRPLRRYASILAQRYEGVGGKTTPGEDKRSQVAHRWS